MICWKPPYIPYEGYIRASDSFITIVAVPSIDSGQTTFKLNEKYEAISLQGTTGPQDQFHLFTGTDDCPLGGEIGEPIVSNIRDAFFVWFPETK